MIGVSFNNPRGIHINVLFPTLLGTGEPQFLQKQEVNPVSFLNVVIKLLFEDHSNRFSFTKVAALAPAPLCLRHKLQWQ